MKFILEYFDFSKHPGLPFIVIGALIFLWSVRRMAKKMKEKTRAGEPKTKDWI